jgi:uncharacterized protein (TIGR00369 family)
MTETQARSRTYSWQNPGDANFAELITMTGLEQLQAMIDGRAPRPPVMDLIGILSMEAEPGLVRVTMRAQEFHYNPLGGVHGGVIATLLDTAAACSVHATLAAGERYTSLDLTTKFLRPLTVDSGLLTCVGTVLQRGRRVALAQAELRDEAGKLAAHATSSCLIMGFGS